MHVTFTLREQIFRPLRGFIQLSGTSFGCSFRQRFGCRNNFKKIVLRANQNHRLALASEPSIARQPQAGNIDVKQHLSLPSSAPKDELERKRAMMDLQRQHRRFHLRVSRDLPREHRILVPALVFLYLFWITWCWCWLCPAHGRAAGTFLNNIALVLALPRQRAGGWHLLELPGIGFGSGPPTGGRWTPC